MNKKILVGLAFIPVALIGFWYTLYQLNLRPVDGGSSETIAFVIEAGQSGRTIAANLESAQLIRSDAAFNAYANLHGLRTKFKSGYYHLSPSQSTAQIAEALAGGKVSQQRLVIPEGSTLVKISQLVKEAGINESDWQAALTRAYDSELAKARPAGLSLEGYLFPDTYGVTKGVSAENLVSSMLTNLEAKFSPDLRQKAAARGYTPHQALTLASIIEREVPKSEDRRIVAQIFYKRLTLGQALESDVTVHYAADILGQPFDLSINSPYNTRRFKGLPPGPIASPGLDAIEAAVSPATTDYLYFLSGDNGTTYFAKTYNEHLANIKNHCQQACR